MFDNLHRNLVTFCSFCIFQITVSHLLPTVQHIVLNRYWIIYFNIEYKNTNIPIIQQSNIIIYLGLRVFQGLPLKDSNPDYRRLPSNSNSNSNSNPEIIVTRIPFITNNSNNKYRRVPNTTTSSNTSGINTTLSPSIVNIPSTTMDNRSQPAKSAATSYSSQCVLLPHSPFNTYVRRASTQTATTSLGRCWYLFQQLAKQPCESVDDFIVWF